MDSDSDGEEYVKTAKGKSVPREQRWDSWAKAVFNKKTLELEYGLFEKKRLRQFIGSRYRVGKNVLDGIQVLFHKYLYNVVFQIVSCYGVRSFVEKIEDPTTKRSTKWTIKVSLDMIAKLFPKPVPEDIALSISFIRIKPLHKLMNKYALHILHTQTTNAKHVKEVHIKEDSVRMLEKGYIFGLLFRTAIAEVREILAKITSLVEVNQRQTITERDVKTVAALTPWAEACLPSQHPFRLFREAVDAAKTKKAEMRKSKPKKATKKASEGVAKAKKPRAKQPPSKAKKPKTNQAPYDEGMGY